jgi:hypothetical protein
VTKKAKCSLRKHNIKGKDCIPSCHFLDHVIWQNLLMIIMRTRNGDQNVPWNGQENTYQRHNSIPLCHSGPMLYAIIFRCCAYILVMVTKMYYGIVKKNTCQREDSILHTFMSFFLTTLCDIIFRWWSYTLVMWTKTVLLTWSTNTYQRDSYMLVNGDHSVLWNAQENTYWRENSILHTFMSFS